MKILGSFLSAVLLLACSVARGDALADKLVGSWQGTLDAGAVKLRLVFNLTQNTSGLTGTLDSLDQGAKGIPVDTVTLNGDAVHLTVDAVRGAYQGTLDASGKTIVGQWSQGGQSLPLNLTKPAPGETPAASEPSSAADLSGSKEAAQKVAGVWNGSLATGAGSLRLRVNITKSAEGTAIGTMDSLDQNAMGIPISAITLTQGKLHFEARGIGGVYEGTLAAEGSAIHGQWRQGGNALPLDLQKAKPQ